MSVEGNLQEQGLGEVLSALSRDEDTGILTIQGEQEIIAVSLLQGEVVGADALNQSLEDGLGEVLEGLRLVRKEEFAGLAAEHQAGGGRVVDLLLERSFVSRDQLLGALRLHTYRLCLQALAWQVGEFKFYHGDEVTYEEGVTPMPVEELLIRAGRDLSSPDLTGGAVPDSESVFGRASGAFGEEIGARGGEAGLAGDGADPLSRAVLNGVNGSRSVAELASLTGISEYKISYLMARWERQGVVERLGTAAAPAAAAVPAAPAASAMGELPLRAAPEPAPEVLYEPPAATVPEARSQPSAWRRGWAAVGALEAGPWPGRALGLGLAAALIFLALARPAGFLLPFPWQEGLRGEHLESQREGLYDNVRRSAKTFFLLQGRFPETLTELVDARLLAPSNLTDGDDRRLRFSATAASFVVQSLQGGEPQAESALTASITGNFLLDPEFEVPAPSPLPPLVLLD